MVTLKLMCLIYSPSIPHIVKPKAEFHKKIVEIFIVFLFFLHQQNNQGS